MADLYTVTAPLMIRWRDGRKAFIAECLRHPKGLVYCEPFWNGAAVQSCMHLIEGELTGSGPWKIGECVITLLGCQGSEPVLAQEYARWQEYRVQQGAVYPTREELGRLALTRFGT